MNKIFVEYVLNNSTQLAITVSPADVLEAVYSFVDNVRFQVLVDILGRQYYEYDISAENGRRIRITEAHYKRGHFIISEHTGDN